MHQNTAFSQVPHKEHRHDSLHTHEPRHLHYAQENGAQTLGQLRPGQSCTIIAIGGEGALKRRLVDMGLTPGCRVTLRKTAPLGDPLEFTLRGYELSLRRADANTILVERDSDAL